MNRNKFIEAIIEEIGGFSDNDLKSLNNEYCEQRSIQDGMIFDNDSEFFSMYFSDPLDAVRATCYGNYTYSDKFIVFNGYANLETLDSLSADDLVDSIDAIAEDVADNFRFYSYLFSVEENDFEEEEEEI
jgi:hypothetical protein